MLSFGYVIFYLGQFLKFPPYVWTIVTSFLITGEGIGIILDTYFCKSSVLDPLCLMPHWHVELWLRDILSRTVLEVPSIRVDNCDLVSHNGGGDRHNTRHIFL